MILVNELYGPVKQAEGKSLGMDCMFLRLAACNLSCTWCDSAYTWNWKGTKFEHPDKFDKEKEVHKMEAPEIYLKLEQLSKVTNLVISGGEPMLQQKQLIPLLNVLKYGYWHVEVETNGTIVPNDDFIELIKQFNCSPKLSNAGKENTREKRLVWEALVKINYSGKGTFKFVVTSDQDLEEIHEIVEIVGIKPKDVWFMAEGRTKEEQLARQDAVKHLAEKEGYNFTPRQHILEFGNKRGV